MEEGYSDASIPCSRNVNPMGGTLSNRSDISVGLSIQSLDQQLKLKRCASGYTKSSCSLRSVSRRAPTWFRTGAIQSHASVVRLGRITDKSDNPGHGKRQNMEHHLILSYFLEYFEDASDLRSDVIEIGTWDRYESWSELPQAHLHRTTSFCHKSVSKRFGYTYKAITSSPS